MLAVDVLPFYGCAVNGRSVRVSATVTHMMCQLINNTLTEEIIIIGKMSTNYRLLLQ